MIDHKNVIVNNPKEGDILFLDNAKKMRFVTLESFDKASFPEDCVIVGVVAYRQGNEALVVNKNNTTKQWSKVFLWDVTGWKIGSASETNIGFYSSQKPAGSVFSYNGNTIDEIVTQLNSWFIKYQEAGSSIQSSRIYRAYKKDESTIRVVLETYGNWYEYILTMSGLTVSYQVGAMLPANTNTYAINGVGGEYKGMNWGKYYSYVHDATSSTFNPTDPLRSIPSYPVSFKCYQSVVGQYLRDLYGEGEDGYTLYLKDNMVKFPSLRGIFSEEFRDGLKNTYLLAAEQHMESDGQLHYTYPAAKYCADTEYANEHLAKGKWFLPTMYNLMKIFSKIKMDYSDIVNHALVAIGGTKLYMSAAWSCCRSSVNASWIFFGFCGSSSSYGFYVSGYAVPCVLLDVSECEL